MLKAIGNFFVWCFVIVLVLGAILDVFVGTEEFADDMPSVEQIEDFRGFEQRGDAGPDQAQDQGPTLPAPSPFDDQSLVEAGDAKNWSSGTGFAIANGLWLTAKHVARGCERLGILNEDGRVAVKARAVYVAENADVAIFQTQGGPLPLALDLDESDIKLGSQGFHVGYPQGKPGEVTSRLIGRELMLTTGAWRGRENTLAWAETGRTRGLSGTLGGLSGGPTLDGNGRVIGITIAENPRRGRVISTVAASMEKALTDADINANGLAEGPLNSGDFAQQAKRLRADLKVVQVICLTT